MTLPTFYGYADAAARLTDHGLDISEPTLKRLVKNGRVPHVRIAGKVKFSDQLLAEFIEANTHRPATTHLALVPGGRRARAGGRG